MAASSYVKPVVGTFKRLDQGIDFQGKPGDPVVAMGLARVDAVKPDPGGFGQAVYYTLMDGPLRGRQIYVGHALPTVHAGQLLQAGDAVATLQEHPGGDATQPGWTEIGFAKDGRPAGASTAKEFQRFFNSAGDASAASPAAPASPADTSSPAAAAASVVPPVAGQDPQLSTAPTIDSTQPLEPPPASGMASTNSYLADLWNRIASQPGSSPNAQALAANAQLLAGG